MNSKTTILLLFVLLSLTACQKEETLGFFDISPEERPTTSFPTIHLIAQEVTIGNYFDFIDSLVCFYDTLLPQPINEHLIIRNNPWVIDSLEATDYYRLAEKGVINLDQKKLRIFGPGNYLVIPDESAVDSLNRLFEETYLDINIPEYVLRIMEGEQVVRKLSVRVGRNERKYLAMAGRVVDLRTITGEGSIVRHSRDPAFINPSNNHYYHVTRRDDGVVTAMPRIPWLEPEINGKRLGQLIHPTTNIETLGRAYSNGCIGTSEADAWRLYYYAPLGTRMVIRYDLEVVNEEGDTLQLRDIYGRSRR
jgi:L,D-transpeptidase ErfK/SrfK